MVFRGITQGARVTICRLGLYCIELDPYTKLAIRLGLTTGNLEMSSILPVKKDNWEAWNRELHESWTLTCLS